MMLTPSRQHPSPAEAPAQRRIHIPDRALLGHFRAPASPALLWWISSVSSAIAVLPSGNGLPRHRTCLHSRIQRQGDGHWQGHQLVPAVPRPSARSSEEYFKDLENRSRCANLPSVSALRSLPRDGKPPFHAVMETMNATIPRLDALPKVGTVNICKSRRELDGVKIELVSPNRVDSSQLLPIVLLARARMDCGEQSFTAMHLRPEDATKLTGEEHPNMPVAIYFSRVVSM